MQLVLPTVLVLVVTLATAVLASTVTQDSEPATEQQDVPNLDVAVEKRSLSADCYTLSHGVVRNGGILKQTPCVSYICQFGNLRLHTEGCSHGGFCWPVNKHFRHKCKSFLCSVTASGSSRFYNVQASGEQQCEDYQGRCYRQGVRHSSVQNGVLRRDCYCQVYGGAYLTTRTTCNY